MIPLVWIEKSRLSKAAAIIYPNAGSQRSKTSARLSNALNRLGQGDTNLLREEAQIQRFLDEVAFEQFISCGQIAIGTSEGRRHWDESRALLRQLPGHAGRGE